VRALVQIADFGTNYTGIGWITLVLPIGLLILVVIWWRTAWGRGSADQADEFFEASGGSPAANKPSDAAPAVVPLLPAATLLPLWLALAAAVVVAALWWRHMTRRAES
jgi:hypothetical protein